MCLVLSVAFVPDAVVCKTDPGRSGGLEPPAAGCKYSVPPRFRPPIGVRRAAARRPAGPSRPPRPRPLAGRARPLDARPATCSPIPGAAFPDGPDGGILIPDGPGRSPSRPVDPPHRAAAQADGGHALRRGHARVGGGCERGGVMGRVGIPRLHRGRHGGGAIDEG